MRERVREGERGSVAAAVAAGRSLHTRGKFGRLIILVFEIPIEVSANVHTSSECCSKKAAVFFFHSCVQYFGGEKVNTGGWSMTSRHIASNVLSLCKRGANLSRDI